MNAPYLLPLLLAGLFTALRAETPDQPVATGRVHWGRDFDQALVASKQSGKPVFLLFQEVPGCEGCQQFGREVLSLPEMVAAIETHFIPVLIPNNRGGRDAEILRRYQEPAWNYQVVRFLDAQGADLIPREDRVWTAPALFARMTRALQAAHRPVPDHWVPTSRTERAAFGQYCFWTGEMKLGQIEGVVKTEAGYLDGHEVTLVEYDPQRVSFDTVVRQAGHAQCADTVYVTNPAQAQLAAKAGAEEVHPLGSGYQKAPPSDQKRQIQGTPLARLELTDEQATKVNAFARVDWTKALGYLNDEQRARLAPQ